MRTCPWLSLVPGLLVLAPIAGAAEGVATEYWGRVIGGVWFASASGDFVADADGVEGDTFEAEDFELDDYEAALMLEASVSLPLFVDLHAGIFSYSVDGEEELLAPRDFDGESFSGTVTTDLQFTDIYGEAAWRPIDFDLVGGSIGLAVHYIDGELQLEEDGSVQSETVAESFPFPAASGRGYANPIDEVSIEARLHLMSLDVADVDATFIDFLATVAYRPVDWFGVVGGYRYVQYDLDVEFDDDASATIDLTLSGPFLGVMAVY